MEATFLKSLIIPSMDFRMGLEMLLESGYDFGLLYLFFNVQ